MELLGAALSPGQALRANEQWLTWLPGLSRGSYTAPGAPLLPSPPHCFPQKSTWEQVRCHLEAVPLSLGTLRLFRLHWCSEL